MIFLERLSFVQIILILAVCVLAKPVLGCGALNLEFESIDVPWSLNGGTIRKTLIVRRSPPYTPCNYFITLSGGITSNVQDRQAKGSGGSLSYQMYSNPSGINSYVIREFENAESSTQMIAGAFDSSSNPLNRHEIYVGFPSNQSGDTLLPHAGLYTDTLTSKVYVGVSNNPKESQLHTIIQLQFKYGSKGWLILH